MSRWSLVESSAATAVVCMQVNKWQTKRTRIELRCSLPPTLHSLAKHRFPVYCVPRLCLITLNGSFTCCFYTNIPANPSLHFNRLDFI